ncbi:hypothetical protein NPIL_318601 [Nephila pilipes]|uniref:Uncharacterized protein n=1 Tax=Nephila pilipes TaxID=299642 RepID=A0A8X6U1I0_NEPPI|nr:hypothetical protein NPIL_318601 [Nephila pilipes]
MEELSYTEINHTERCAKSKEFEDDFDWSRRAVEDMNTCLSKNSLTVETVSEKIRDQIEYIITVEQNFACKIFEVSHCPYQRKIHIHENDYYLKLISEYRLVGPTPSPEPRKKHKAVDDEGFRTQKNC